MVEVVILINGLAVMVAKFVMLSTPVWYGPLSTVVRYLNVTLEPAGSANVGVVDTDPPENAYARGSIFSQTFEAISVMTDVSFVSAVCKTTPYVASAVGVTSPRTT